MNLELSWRGPFENAEVNELHAAAFQTRLYSDDVWDWRQLVDTHSLGWLVARDQDGLVGFANVVWDGVVHAWIQDVMVADRAADEGSAQPLFERAPTARGRPAARCSMWTSTTTSPRSTSARAASPDQRRSP